MRPLLTTAIPETSSRLKGYIGPGDRANKKDAATLGFLKETLLAGQKFRLLISYDRS